MEELRLVGPRLLAPWQKLEAIQMFVLPRIQYLMRNCELPAPVYADIEEQVYRVLRQ